MFKIAGREDDGVEGGTGEKITTDNRPYGNKYREKSGQRERES